MTAETRKNMRKGAHSSPRQPDLGYSPLYKRVKTLLTARIADGRWQPGQIIPNEFQIAEELNVSQGTVRKALHEMTMDHLLVRRQGRGTFVASYDDERVLFQFFKLRPDRGARAFPDSTVLSLTSAAADERAAEALAIKPAERVWKLRRLRTLQESPVIVESIALPQSIFPDIDRLDEIPNNVYGLYSSRYGVTVAQAEERLKAISATAEMAGHLGCTPNTPLIEIDRRAIGLDGRPVEWRLSACLTASHHYYADLK